MLLLALYLQPSLAYQGFPVGAFSDTLSNIWSVLILVWRFTQISRSEYKAVLAVACVYNCRQNASQSTLGETTHCYSVAVAHTTACNFFSKLDNADCFGQRSLRKISIHCRFPSSFYILSHCRCRPMMLRRD